MRKVIQIAIPMLLVGLGIYLLVGCIPVPGNFQQSSGFTRPEERIGSPDADRPLKVGSAGYEKVIRLLGPPTLDSTNHQAVVYSYQVNDISYVWPLCFSIDPIYRDRHLLLRFNSDGILQSFKVYKDMQTLRRDVSYTELKPGPGAPRHLRQKY
jgi:hypothetical protein